MKDILTNKIESGTLLLWLPPKDLSRLVVRAVRVHDGGLSKGDTGETTPPMLTIAIDIPVTVNRPGDEAVLADFVVVVDPRSVGLVDKMLTQ